MASKSLRGLNEAMRGLSVSSATTKTAAPAVIRSMATETSPVSPVREHYKPPTSVPLTIFGFPSYEPQRLESWSTKHLNVPLRRDILHLAVVYEGDNTRQGTANTKNRWEIHGSHRKIRPQKGTGRARLGTKQSPLLKGGGKSFGPKPRDFGTKLNRKVYDLAWRTALSYRYRRGELIVCEDGMEIPVPEEFQAILLEGELQPELHLSFLSKWTRQILDNNSWGRSCGRTTFITTDYRTNLFESLDAIPNYGSAMNIDEVDVKDLLTTGRLVIERSALLELISRHQSDLVSNVFIVNGALPNTPESGEVLVG